MILILLIVSLALSSCFSSYMGDEGNLIIRLGAAGGAGRALPASPTLNEFTHTITLSGGPGGTRTRSGVRLGETVSFNVEPGDWNIEVKAFLGGVLRGGNALETNVEITEGRNPPIPITMKAYAPGLYQKNAEGGYTTGFDNPLAAAIPAAIGVLNGSSGDYVYLADTAEIDPQTLSGAAGGLTLTLQGYNKDDTLTLPHQGSLFTVDGNAALTLDHITLQGKGYILNTAPLVTVQSGAKLVLKTGSKITGNTFIVTASETGGAGILVDNAELEISGGEVSDNIARGTVENMYGGGIYAKNSSRVVMSGGAIRDNKVEHTMPIEGFTNGGGISIRGGDNAASPDSCEFAMSGGIIEGNTVSARANGGAANASGGGVALVNKAYFDFSGGIIRDNHCSAVSSGTWGNSTGGGIILGGASCDMSGGVVSGNTTKHNNITEIYSGMFLFGAWAGGVYSSVSPGSGLNSYFKKTGGVVYGNEAAGNDEDGIALANKAQKDTGEAGDGHALVFDTINTTSMIKRNSSAYDNDKIDSGVSGPAGGWE